MSQSNPNWMRGYVPPASEWNSLWAKKQDDLTLIPGTDASFMQVFDGASHPLNTVTQFGSLNTTGWTLPQWQAVLSASTALTDELFFAALQSTINHYGALGNGGTIYLPFGTALTNKEITQPFNNIRIIGSGVGLVHDVRIGGPKFGTLIRYNGTAATPSVLTIAPLSDLVNGTVNSGCHAIGFMVDGNSVAQHDIVIKSIEWSDIDLAAINSIDYAVVFDTVPLSEHNDTQHLKIRLAIANLGASSGGGVTFQASGGTVTGSANNGNFSLNDILDIAVLVNNGVGVNLSGTDNNTWNRVGVFKLGSGNAITGSAAQAEIFNYLGTNATPIVFDGPTTRVQINSLDTSNGTPEPIKTNGALVEYNDNINGLRSGLSAKQVQFYDSETSRAQFVNSGKLNPFATLQIVNASSDHIEILTPDGLANLFINIDSNGNPRVFTTTGGTLQLNNGGPVSIGGPLTMGNVGFNGSTAQNGKISITGSKGGNTALASVISLLVAYGLATDSTT